jgi:drug/metabolite transporter (DMT)-like permease
MRALQIVGAVLIVVGLWVILRPPNYSHEQSVLKLGEVEAKVERQQPVPGWIGGIALGAGVVLVVAGFGKR